MINELIGSLDIDMMIRTFEEGGPTQTWFNIQPRGVDRERAKELKKERKFLDKIIAMERKKEKETERSDGVGIGKGLHRAV